MCAHSIPTLYVYIRNTTPSNSGCVCVSNFGSENIAGVF